MLQVLISAVKCIKDIDPNSFLSNRGLQYLFFTVAVTLKSRFNLEFLPVLNIV